MFKRESGTKYTRSVSQIYIYNIYLWKLCDIQLLSLVLFILLPFAHHFLFVFCCLQSNHISLFHRSAIMSAGTSPALSSEHIHLDNAPGVSLILTLAFNRHVPMHSIYYLVYIKEGIEELCTLVNHLNYQTQLLDQSLKTTIKLYLKVCTRYELSIHEDTLVCIPSIHAYHR